MLCTLIVVRVYVLYCVSGMRERIPTRRLFGMLRFIECEIVAAVPQFHNKTLLTRRLFAGA
jgi:hypothetical protein